MRAHVLADIVLERSRGSLRVALVSLLLLHRLTSLTRFQPLFGRLTDHRVRVLVLDGRLRRDQLRMSGLTDAVPARDDSVAGDLVDAGMRASTGSPSDQHRTQQ